MTEAKTQIPPSVVQPPATRMPRRRGIATVNYWWFLVPAMIGVFALIVVPIGFTFYFSLRNYNLQLGSDSFAGFDNYARLLSGENAGFIAALFRTLFYVFIVITADFVLAMSQALLLFSMRAGWAKFWRAIFILPILIIPTASAVFWRNVMYSPEGGQFLQALGLSGIISPPLGDPQLALWAIMITSVWAWSPWVFILLAAGLDQIDKSVLEASMVDGASYFQRLRTIIFPLMKPVIFVTLSFKALDSFLAFPFVWLMTQGGPGDSTHVLSTFIYQQAFTLLDYGNGSAMAIVMLIVSGALSVGAVLGWQRFYGKEA